MSAVCQILCCDVTKRSWACSPEMLVTSDITAQYLAYSAREWSITYTYIHVCVPPIYLSLPTSCDDITALCRERYFYISNDVNNRTFGM